VSLFVGKLEPGTEGVDEMKAGGGKKKVLKKKRKDGDVSG
jgi:hypothetical protein